MEDKKLASEIGIENSVSLINEEQWAESELQYTPEHCWTGDTYEQAVSNSTENMIAFRRVGIDNVAVVSAIFEYENNKPKNTT